MGQTDAGWDNILTGITDWYESTYHELVHL